MIFDSLQATESKVALSIDTNWTHLSMLGYLTWLTLRGQDCSDEPGPVPQVIVLVKLGQVEDILGDELSLWRVGEIHLHSQVDNLKLDWHLLGKECLGLVSSLRHLGASHSTPPPPRQGQPWHQAPPAFTTAWPSGG